MNNNEKVKKIVAIGILSAIVVVLQIIGNYFQFIASLNLALIPVAVAGIVIGPFGGLIVGMIDGIITIFSPSTLEIFFSVNPFGTIFTCVIKMSLAGLISGLVFKAFKGKHKTLSSILSSIIVPLTNTIIFSLCSLIFFVPVLDNFINEEYTNIYAVLIFVLIGWNFLIEFSISAILSPVVVRLTEYSLRKKK